MIEKIKLPYKLYKRGEFFHAKFSFLYQGERIQFRETTKKRIFEEAERYCIERIAYFEKKQDNLEFTIDEAFGRFMEENGNYQAYPRNLMRRLNILAKGLGHNTKLTEFTPQLITNHIENRKKSVKNATINRELTDLIAVVNMAKNKWEVKTTNLQISQFKLKEPAENIKYLKNWNEAQRIIDNAPSHLKPIIYTALYTGLRLGNILSLKWENLDSCNKTITVKVKDKNTLDGKNHTIPIIPELSEILNQQPRLNQFIFNYRGNPVSSIKTAWKNCFTKDMRYINFHTLRHTCATWLLKNTNNLKLVKEVLGHADLKTTLKYAHILDEDKRIGLSNTFAQKTAQF